MEKSADIPAGQCQAYSTYLLSLLVGRCCIRLRAVELCLHTVQPLVEVFVCAGEARGELQRLLQGAEGLAAAGRHLGVARLDAVELLLDQQNLLTCRRTRRDTDVTESRLTVSMDDIEITSCEENHKPAECVVMDSN